MKNSGDQEEVLRRQLTAFAQFTTRSLGEADLNALMTDACLRARAGVHVTLLEYLPSRDRLIMRAGVGWKDGYVGQYEVAPDPDTPIGHALALSKPVQVSDYGSQTKYCYPEILEVHGCISSVNVPVQTDSGNFGILEIDHTSARTFTSDDIYFLTGLGNTIAQAVELKRALQAMAAAVDAKQLLVQEMNHRIKNNLSLVGAMLSLQARRFSDASMRDEFSKAVSRINNLSLVHDRLQAFTSGESRMDAAAHFEQLCEMLRSLVPARATLTARCSGTLPGDCVESLTLIANELVTNAAKYAFAGRESGAITVGYQEEGAGWRLWVEDNGNGLPPDHEERSKNSFGRMLIATLASRVNAEVRYSLAKGTRVDVFCGVSR